MPCDVIEDTCIFLTPSKLLLFNTISLRNDTLPVLYELIAFVVVVGAVNNLIKPTFVLSIFVETLFAINVDTLIVEGIKY